MKVFEYVNAICASKDSYWEDGVSESEYEPFLVNRALSHHYDTVMYAQEMNARSHISEKMQYDFLRIAIQPKKKRFAKWDKEKDEKIELIKKAYKVSYKTAISYAAILNNEDLVNLKLSLCKGGLGNAK
jgi:hypothetical protein